MSNLNWWADVEATIDRWSLLKHPFYQAWQLGKLTLEDLAAYSRMYYPHVAAFPRYVSATHSVCADQKVRQMLVENLVEEEQGPENHPELWARFSEKLGVSRDTLVAEAPAKTRRCVETFERLTKKSALSGLAALYSYESQIPAVSETKLDGLKKFYGVTDPEGLKFFEVHAKADVWHSQQEREAIEKLATTDEAREEVKVAVEAACQAVWQVLDGVCEARGIHCPSLN